MGEELSNNLAKLFFKSRLVEKEAPRMVVEVGNDILFISFDIEFMVRILLEECADWVLGICTEKADYISLKSSSILWKEVFGSLQVDI